MHQHKKGIVMKNLGKIFLLIFFISKLFAGVKLYVDRDHITLGDSVTVRLVIQGEEYSAPDITKLCDSDIIATSKQQSIRIINGSIAKEASFIYTFEPEKSCEIAPIPIKVDGKIEKTKPIKIVVSNNPTPSKDQNFILELHTNKKELFVGESFEVVLTFKQKQDAEVLDYKFFPPKLDGFWIKHQSKPKKYEENGYIVTTITYKMAAQRAGKLTISPAKIKIASRDYTRDYWNNFSPSLKWRSYYSNSITLDVKSPPSGIKLVGDFDLKVSVDKTKVHAGEAVTAIITIHGDGNVEDLIAFKPYIEDVSVFEQKPKIDEQNGVFNQKITFVADQNFTIPSFSIRFFNPNTKAIVTKKSDPIAVEVIGATKSASKPLVIKKAQPSSSNTNATNGIETSFAITWMILSFFAGAFIGGALVFLKLSALKAKKSKKIDFNDKKMLLIKLLPYKDDKEVKAIIEMLEEHFYSGKDVTLDKKRLKEILQKYGVT